MIITAVCTCTEHSVAERAAHAFLFCLKIFPGRTIPLLVTLIANEVRKTGGCPTSTCSTFAYILCRYNSGLNSLSWQRYCQPSAVSILSAGWPQIFSQNRKALC